jgi:hypothetical protein
MKRIKKKEFQLIKECRYCHMNDGDLKYSFKLDTFVHEDCIVAVLSVDPQDEEANLLAKEMKINLEEYGLGLS